MIKVSLLSIIQNNEDIIKEWIEHYLAEGIGHFYLVDDNANEKTKEILNGYQKFITFTSKTSSKVGNSEGSLINNLFINRLKEESEWALFAMPNEYIYAKNRIAEIPDIFKRIDEKVEKIWIPNVYFGSNELISQPKSITKGFTKRQELEAFIPGNNGRVLCRTQNLTRILDEGRNVKLLQNDIFYLCNGQRTENFKFTQKAFLRLNLSMNTYMPMSKEYYENQVLVKYRKGSREYNAEMRKFDEWEILYNKVSDTELADKIYAYNPDIYEK